MGVTEEAKKAEGQASVMVPPEGKRMTGVKVRVEA